MNLFYSPYLDFVRKCLPDIHGVIEKMVFDTPGFYVGDKLFARVKEDGETLVLYTEEREKWMESDPETFFITDHYKNYKYMLVGLETVKPEILKQLLTEAWRKRAPKKLVKEFDKKQE